MKQHEKTTTKPSASFSYYTGDIYWNNFEETLKRMNARITGRDDVSWQQYLKRRIPCPQKGFFLNCGNGWVERDLFRLGVIAEATGMDFSEQSLSTAREEAHNIGMPALYFSADCNHFEALVPECTLVVNHAAMHHVARINDLTCKVAKLIRADGWYVGFDYVGPHRNQYPWEMWKSMVELNRSLPERYRIKLTYPHLKTMLHTDPTEAIHSELQVEVMKQYFDVHEYVQLGGTLAYGLLFQNLNLFKERATPEGAKTVRRILDADREFLALNPDMNLFAFWIAAPKTQGFPSDEQIRRWQQEEDERESWATRSGGRYYPETALETIYNDFDEWTRNS